MPREISFYVPLSQCTLTITCHTDTSQRRKTKTHITSKSSEVEGTGGKYRKKKERELVGDVFYGFACPFHHETKPVYVYH